MKKTVLLFLSFVIVILILFQSNSQTITTYNTAFFASNTGTQVSHRELAIASALSYMPIPLSCKKSDNCKFSDRSIIVDQFNQYVNLHNYASTLELDDWNIVDYIEKKTTIANVSAIFNAYTLKNNNDIIIVFRGTDFTDLLEWLQHLSYGIDDIHSQESYAEEYILRQSKKYKNCNIYITGHSLGGYLTHVAAATLEKAIINGKTGSVDWSGFNLSKNKYSLNEFLNEKTKDFSDYKNVNFVQAVSFNGMGFLFNYSTGTTVQDAKMKVLSEMSNNIYNESKLINYRVRGDIVSSLGIKYGEVRTLDAALDSASYHKKNYVFLEPLKSARAVEFLVNYNTKIKEYVNNHIGENLSEVYKYYGMNSVVGYLNLTHESDEFACLLNGNEKPEVKIVEETPWLLSTQANYIKSYLSKEQSNDIISNSKITTTLRALTYGACARKYEWYECNDENRTECNVIKKDEFSGDVNNFNNKNNLLDVTVNKGNTKYYFVRSYYNDNYYSSRLINNTTNEYSKGEIIKNHEGYVDSDIIKVISDTEKPNCKFNMKKVNVSLKKVLFWYENSTKNISFTCTDSKSGFDITKKIFSPYFYTSNVGLIPSIIIDDVNVNFLSKNKIVIDLTVTATRVPTSLTPKVNFNGLITDMANNTSSNTYIEFNITGK